MSFDRDTGRDRCFAVLARELGELVDPATGRLSEESSHPTYEAPYSGADLTRDALADRLDAAELEPLAVRSGPGYKPHCPARCRV